MNYFGELSSKGFLTEYDFQNFEFFYSNIYQEENDFCPKVSAGICQSEPKYSYNLRSGPKQVSQIPKRKTTPPAKKLSNQTQEKR